ncbi:MAG: hypothetical protein C0619_11120 [Desulfuromonas sp.]|nr:MAG: hypothetical protein C0619_11120 [Desulfuromonas sp.]
MVREFANLVQLLLIAHGGMTLLTGVLPELMSGRFTAMLLALFGSLVVAMALLLYPCFGFNRHLPKKIFLPQIFLLLWTVAGLWPLATKMDPFALEISAATAQVLLGLFALVWFRIKNGSSLLLTREMFPGKGFGLRNLLWFSLASLLFLPLVLIFFGFSAATGYVEQLSGGFVRLGVDGLYMAEQVYRQQDKTVRLAGMIHIGDQDYYDELSRSISAEPVLVLSEGVSDRDGLLRREFSYVKIADALGLSGQHRLQFPGRRVDIDQIYRDGFNGAQQGTPDVAGADIDLREFDPLTIEFINAMATHLLSSASLIDGFAAFNGWAQENLPPTASETIMHDLVDKRNQVVLGHLDAALKKYDTVVIPWGALHMAGIEAAVRKRGFILQQSRERRSIAFGRLPYADLLKTFGNSRP